MAEDIDKATEARRKALRNGEEDPVIVAQRFLNIYRQRHIFSAERKAAFDKMLLELSPEIRGLFSSLPGGVMLQDYVDELAEQNGVAKSSAQSQPVSGLNSEAHQQAQILATALAQSQVLQQPAAAAPSGGKISMDKDFAAELAKVMGGLMQQQSNMQKESLEKLALDLSKTQIFIAKTMKEDKAERQSEIDALCKSLSEGKKDDAGEKTHEAESFYKELAAAHQADREEQRREIAELCKTIAQSHTALISSLSNLGTEKREAASAPQPILLGNDETTKKLIEAVLDGQKQLNSRLDKVEELSISKANDNRQMLSAFEKSQAEIIKTLASVKSDGGSPSVVQVSGSEERLAQIIGESQEKLITALLSANLQQNNVAQSTNNANNIQITAPDNSAQLLLLVDKIASLQAANEENLEKAITRAIEEQGRLFDKISRQQTKELAEMIAESIKEAGRPVVYTMPVSPVAQPQSAAASNAEPAVPFEEIGHIPPKMEELDEFKMEILPEDENPQKPIDSVSSVAEPEDFSFEREEMPIENEFAADEMKIEENIAEKAVPDEDAEQEIAASENGNEIILSETSEMIEGEPAKKKKKRKKKKKKKTTETIEPDVQTIVEEQPVDGDMGKAGDFTAEMVLPMEDDTVADDMSVTEAEIGEQPVLEAADTIFEEEVPLEDIAATDNLPSDESTDFWADLPDVGNVLPEPLGDDWGFGSADAEVQTIGNDNALAETGQDDYVEAGNDNEEFVEAIGNNSYIYSSDLYSQEKISEQSALMYGSAAEDLTVRPIIIGLADDNDDIDPYQNSILKD